MREDTKAGRKTLRALMNIDLALMYLDREYEQCKRRHKKLLAKLAANEQQISRLSGRYS